MAFNPGGVSSIIEKCSKNVLNTGGVSLIIEKCIK
jgi:hypothetical protein